MSVISRFAPLGHFISTGRAGTVDSSMPGHDPPHFTRHIAIRQHLLKTVLNSSQRAPLHSSGVTVQDDGKELSGDGFLDDTEQSYGGPDNYAKPRQTPQAKWVSKESTIGDEMLVRCSGCYLDIRTGRVSDGPRDGCTLTAREIEALQSMPEDQRPLWEDVTNCNGENARLPLHMVTIERAKRGEDEQGWYRPPECHELSKETRKHLHLLDCWTPEAEADYLAL